MPQNAIIVKNVLEIEVVDVPSNADLVASIPNKMSGIKIGSDKTGKRALFVFAFDIIAEIIVVEPASPMLPIKIVMKKNRRFLISSKLIKIRKNITARIFIASASIILNNNLPKKIEAESMFNLSSRLVPRSSSLTKLFAIPVIEAKNIITQSKPDESEVLNFSPAVENTIIVIVVRINKNTAEIA